MSLVLEALRRVERSEGVPGAVGVALSSYRPARRRTRFVPLLLGVLCGVALVLLLGPTSKMTVPPTAPSKNTPVSAPPLPAAVVQPAVESKANATAPVPPTTMSSTAPNAPLPRDPAIATSARRASVAQAPAGPPALVLQAISERDHHPIAIISDRLVKEGEMLNGVRVLHIGSDSVDVMLESGKREVVRFAPPPPDPTPSPAVH